MYSVVILLCIEFIIILILHLTYTQHKSCNLFNRFTYDIGLHLFFTHPIGHLATPPAFSADPRTAGAPLWPPGALRRPAAARCRALAADAGGAGGAAGERGAARPHLRKSLGEILMRFGSIVNISGYRNGRYPDIRFGSECTFWSTFIYTSMEKCNVINGKTHNKMTGPFSIAVLNC